MTPDDLKIHHRIRNHGREVARHPWYCSSTDELLELLNTLDDPTFGICWDTGHAHMAGINQPEALRTIGKNSKALHVADDRGKNDDHVAPYFGTIVWEPIIRALRERDS